MEGSGGIIIDWIMHQCY